MATISIANLPAFTEPNAATNDQLVMVDVSDLSASPLGTTKRISFAAAVGNITGSITVNGNLTVGGTLTVSGNTQLGTITAGTWNGSPIGPTFGGTGQTAYATGDTLYAPAANTLARLPIGTANQVLTVVGGVPSWQPRVNAPIAAADVGSGTFPGTYTFANTVTVTGGLTLTAPLGPTSGGTGLTAYATGDVLYASAANTLTRLPIGTTNQVLAVVGGVPTG